MKYLPILLTIILCSCNIGTTKLCGKAKVTSYVCNNTRCKVYFQEDTKDWYTGLTLERNPRVGDTFVKPCRFDYWIKKRIVSNAKD